MDVSICTKAEFAAANTQPGCTMKTINLTKGQELIVIGDVHENEWHFNEMIRRAEAPNRIFVFVGDIYDKGAGPKTAESIIRTIKKMCEEDRAFMVKGNHEEKNIKRFLNEKKKLTSGLRWCKKLPLALSFVFSNQNRITVVHAGVTPHHSWQDLSENTEVMYVRSLDENDNPIPLVWTNENGARILRPAKEGGITWHKRYDGRFGYIVSGHDSQEDGVAKFYSYSCNVDTKCYKTGILAGQVIKDDGLGELVLVQK